MTVRWLAILAAIVLGFAGGAGLAQPAAAPGAAALAAPFDSAARSVERRFAADGQDFPYTASAGWLAVPSTGGQTVGEIFHVAYRRGDVGGAGRPIIFAFNGGPGAASVYLHLGAMGPRRATVGPDGVVPGSNPPLVDNAESWLGFADLVFVDPIGTGLSRAVAADGSVANGREFWDTEADARAAARFVRDYLDRIGRRASPVYLVGESYGGFRVARLARMLPESYGVRLAGIVMVSPVIDRGAMAIDPFMPMATMLRVPTYAAVAWRHGRAAGIGRDESARDAFVAEAEAFALGDGLIAAVAGDTLPRDRRKAFYAQLARFTGLSTEETTRRDGVIGPDVFANALLADSGRALGFYDASVTGPRGDRMAGLRGLGSALAMAIESYLGEDIGLVAPSKYIPLNQDAARDWQWFRRGDFGYPNAAPRLREALVADPALRVLIVHGRYDLVTPFAATAWTIAQLHLPPARRSAVRLVVLEGGHMMYLHDESRRQLSALAREFVAAPIPPAP